MSRSPISDRIEKILHFKSITASEFAEAIDVQRSSISHILSGRNKPSLDFIQRIVKAYPDISYAWLIDGMNESDFEESASTIAYVTNVNNDKPEEDHSEKKNIEQKKSAHIETGGREIDRIVIFYKNGEFESYSPTS